MKMISILIDFRPTSIIATQYASWLSQQTGASVNLLHVTAEEDPDIEEIKSKLIDFSGIEGYKVEYSVSVGRGEYLHEIPKLLKLVDADFVVIGTHGLEGVYQALFGSNVIKLIQSIQISALIVQGQTKSPADLAPRILFPVGIHQNFDAMMEKTAEWALDLNGNVDIFTLLKDGADTYNDFIANTDKAKSYFDKVGVRYKTVIQEPTIYSVGYAREILSYAKENSIGLITMLSQVSDENRYFGNVDKTNLVLNPQGIPVLAIA